MNAEYKRRATTHRVGKDVSRSKSTFCVSKYKRIDSVLNVGFKIEKYSSELNCFEEILDISVGQRDWFEVVLHKNKIFVLGGCKSEGSSISVSNLKMETKS